MMDGPTLDSLREAHGRAFREGHSATMANDPPLLKEVEDHIRGSTYQIREAVSALMSIADRVFGAEPSEPMKSEATPEAGCATKAIAFAIADQRSIVELLHQQIKRLERVA